MKDKLKWSSGRIKQYDRLKKHVGSTALSIDVVDSILKQCKSKSAYTSKASLLRRMWYEQYGYTKESYSDIEWYFANRGPITSRKQKVPQYLSEDEINRLYSGCSSDRQYAFIWFLYYTGMRVTEVVNVRMCDLRFERDHVQLTYHSLKTPHICKRELPKDMVKFLLNTFMGETYLLETGGGKPTRREYIAKQISKVSLRSVGWSVNPHAFRHHWITDKYEKGYSLEWIAQMVGHKNPEYTYRNYIHRGVTA